MKLLGAKRRNCGLTMLETLVVIFSLFILVAILLPALGAAAMKRNKIGCTDHLKQLGLSFRIWEGDNSDKYPMSISVTNGGALEFAAAGNAVAIFQVMSNPVSSPKLLVCPADTNCWPASSFKAGLTSKNISYFINPDANEANPQAVMLGDDNLQVRGVRVKSGLLELSSNTAVSWTPDRHGLSANLAMADGSVQSATDSGLRVYLSLASTNTIRLAIP